jgi:hypothetical protein
MINRGVPGHSLSNIRTIRGQSQRVIPAYKAYLQVSFMELERARHGQEIRTGQARLDRLRDRCNHLEREKIALLTAVGQQSAAVVATPGAVRTLRNGRRQFAISY